MMHCCKKRLTCLVVALATLAVSVCNAQDRQLASNGRLLLGTASNLSASVVSGDVDGDGDLDLVVANGRHWPQQNFLFLNQSGTRFNVARPLGTDRCTSYRCELADLDGDGDLDIAVANDNAPCLVFLNDGKAKFTRHCEVGAPTSVRSLTASDVDSDGDVDLLVACRGRVNRIHFNDGKAGFDRTVNFGAKGSSTIGVAVADLNEDGHNDLILANRDSQPNTILLATGQWDSEDEPAFESPKPFGAEKLSSRAVAVADFNDDGHADWVMANIGQPNTVCFGDGKGGVKREITIGTEGASSFCLAVADLNNDGAMDFVVGNIGQPNEVYFNVVNEDNFTSITFGNPKSVTYGLCVGDLNGDGFADVVAANSGQQNRIYINGPKTKKASR